MVKPFSVFSILIALLVTIFALSCPFESVDNELPLSISNDEVEFNLLQCVEDYLFCNFNDHPLLFLMSKNHQFDNGLTINYPNGGETLSGNVLINWTLSNEYVNDNPSYSVFYSPNNGKRDSPVQK